MGCWIDLEPDVQARRERVEEQSRERRIEAEQAEKDLRVVSNLIRRLAPVERTNPYFRGDGTHSNCKLDDDISKTAFDTLLDVQKLESRS
ncbi:hypothetical protein LTR70_008955 [Exophiala xenobiotica]|uniref:Uncharacterized protein n=1 Tax=Lithohypha guttulata TaxID=1690604 RepID=A0ABR0JZP8_9EURO|nr:hypothetical protein LTR24_008691 [Lithohypha guttulata]KAK5311192.1 hypothetical protein LTR70_008955 [Exophiala xenobiotica]